jgi:F-box-like/WD domain, G-beta repeat
MEEEALAPSLGDLPAEVAACILSQAGALAAARASTTCHAWRSAAAYPPLWRDLLKRDWAPSGRCASWTSSTGIAWQRLYGRWASATPRVSELREHSSASDGARRRVAALAFDASGALFSAGDDGTIAAWHAETGTITSRAESAHGGAQLGCLCASDTLLATGGADNALRLWDARLGLDAPPVLIIPGAHAGEIFSCIGLGNGLFASGGGDETVRVWDSRAGGDAPPLLEMEGGCGYVFALAHDTLASRLYAGIGRDICMFDLQDGEWLSTLSDHGGDVSALALGERSLLSGGDDGKVCQWRLPPPGSAVEEEQKPERVRRQTLVDSWRGGEGVRDTSITALVGLGEGPAAHLAATWQGGLVLGELDMLRMRPFGARVWESGVAITALAARERVVAVGADTGALSFLRMDVAAISQQPC